MNSLPLQWPSFKWLSIVCYLDNLQEQISKLKYVPSSFYLFSFSLWCKIYLAKDHQNCVERQKTSLTWRKTSVPSLSLFLLQSLLDWSTELNQSQHVNFHVTILVIEPDKGRFIHSILAPIFEFNVNGNWLLVRFSRFHFQNYTKMVFAAIQWPEENSVSVLDENELFLAKIWSKKREVIIWWVT